MATILYLVDFLRKQFLNARLAHVAGVPFSSEYLRGERSPEPIDLATPQFQIDNLVPSIEGNAGDLVTRNWDVFFEAKK